MDNIENKTNNQINLFLNNISILAVFYSTALWLEMAETWEHPGVTFWFLILLLGIIFTKVNLFKLCSFILFSTAYFLYFHFPEVANHVNLILFANLVILITAIYCWLRPNHFIASQDLYETVSSPLRVSLIAVYFWAGFHKLNTDFLNPYFSCSNSMFLGILEMLESRILGIPTWLILGLITLVFLKNIIPDRLIKLTPNNSRKLAFIAILSTIILILATGILFYLNVTGLLFPLFVLATSVAVILWELIGGIMMLFPRWQVIMFCLSMFMHLVLSPIGFVDFGSLAFALWLTFIPANYYPCLQQLVTIPLINIKVNRILLYVLINIFGGLISGFYYLAYPNFNLKAIAGIVFIISVLIVIAPLSKQLLARPDSWHGVSVIKSKIPWLTYLLFAVLFFYATTSYLGLRTAGNFSMFSNLRTEGETSNHLLLRTNPLKIWNYQEDVVKVIEIDDEQAKIGHKYRPLKDHYLPVVEFKKLIYKWTKAGYKVPLVFEYGDRTFSTTDIVNEPIWRTPKRTWEMKLLDFRIIQPDNGEPNYCRW